MPFHQSNRKGRHRPQPPKPTKAPPQIEINTLPHTGAGAPGLCSVTWGSEAFIASAADIRATARDLITCAAYAELLASLLRLGLPGHALGQMIAEILVKNEACRQIPMGDGVVQPVLGLENTLTLTIGASSAAAEGCVLVTLGPMGGTLPPAEARQMGADWYGVAEAAESDCLVATALDEVGHLDGETTGRIFAYMAALRDVHDQARRAPQADTVG